MPGLPTPDRASDVQRPMTSDSPTPERSGMLADFWPHVDRSSRPRSPALRVSYQHWPHSDADSFGSGGLGRASQIPQRSMLSVSMLLLMPSATGNASRRNAGPGR